MAITISKKQQSFHVLTELASVALVVPFLYSVANEVPNEQTKSQLRTLAMITLLVDGGLLLKWLKESKGKSR